MESGTKVERQRIRKKRPIVIADPREGRLTPPQYIIATAFILIILLLMLRWWVF